MQRIILKAFLIFLFLGCSSTRKVEVLESSQLKDYYEKSTFSIMHFVEDKGINVLDTIVGIKFLKDSILTVKRKNNDTLKIARNNIKTLEKISIPEIKAWQAAALVTTGFVISATMGLRKTSTKITQTGDGSCPYVYLNQKGKESLQAELLTGAITKDLTYTDWIPLNNFSPQDEIIISNELPEIHYIDSTRLHYGYIPNHHQGYTTPTQKLFSGVSDEGVDLRYEIQASHTDSIDYEIWEHSFTSEKGSSNEGLLIEIKNTLLSEIAYGDAIQYKYSSWPRFLNRLAEDSDFKQKIKERADKTKLYAKYYFQNKLVHQYKIDHVGPKIFRKYLLPDPQNTFYDKIELIALSGFWEMKAMTRVLELNSVNLKKLALRQVNHKDWNNKVLANYHNTLFPSQRDTLTFSELNDTQFKNKPLAKVKKAYFLSMSGYYQPLPLESGLQNAYNMGKKAQKSLQYKHVLKTLRKLETLELRAHNELE